MLVNKVNGGGGFLYNRLRYLRTREKTQLKKNLQPVDETAESMPTIENNQSATEGSQIVTNNDDGAHDPYQMDDLLFLKTVIVNEKNMPKIHDKLRKTLERRRELLNTEKVDMLENFPFMFVHPSLVSQFDFIFLIILRLNVVTIAYSLSFTNLLCIVFLGIRFSSFSFQIGFV